jgi:hypothetical protein
LATSFFALGMESLLPPVGDRGQTGLKKSVQER